MKAIEWWSTFGLGFLIGLGVAYRRPVLDFVRQVIEYERGDQLPRPRLHSVDCGRQATNVRVLRNERPFDWAEER